MRHVRYLVVVLVVVFAALATAAFAFRGDRQPAKAAPDAAFHPHVRETWRAAIDAGALGLPATDQAGVVVTAGNARVVAVSRAGIVEWSTPLDGAVENPPRIDHELVFVAATRAVAALDRDDGHVVWSTPTATGLEENRANRPVVAGNTVVATTVDGVVLGLDRATGVERWRTELATETTADPAVGHTAGEPPVVVVVGIAEWWGIDPATGRELWSGDLGLFGTSSPVVYPDGSHLVAAVASDEHLVAVDAHSGALRWNTTAAQSELYQVPVIAAHGTELLVPDHWGRVTAYRPADGLRLWTAKGRDAIAEWGEPVWISEQFVALALDVHGPRLASPQGSIALPTPGRAYGVADLPRGGLVVTTATDESTNYVVLYDISYP